jgi:hypothetical protein
MNQFQILLNNQMIYLFHHYHHQKYFHYHEYDRKNFVQYPTKVQVHFVVQLYNLDYLDHLNEKFYKYLENFLRNKNFTFVVGEVKFSFVD